MALAATDDVHTSSTPTRVNDFVNRGANQKAAGLPEASVVRWKLFTLDASLVIRRAGALSARDRTACRERQPMAL